MELICLDEKQIKTVFNDHIVHDFPTSEIRPLDSMLKLYHQERYLCFGLYDNTLLGYAFFTYGDNPNHLLLDYFAIVNNHRNSGLGSIFLSLLKNRLHHHLIIAEVESIESTSDHNEKKLRHRRIQFYKNNGFKDSLVTCHLFGVHYTILYLYQQSITSDEIYQSLNSIYHTLFNKIVYKLFIKMKNKSHLK